MFSTFYKASLIKVVWLTVLVVLLQLSSGALGPVIVLGGFVMALVGREQYACMCYCLLPFLIIVNPCIFRVTSVYALSARFGVILLSAALLVKNGLGRGRGAPILGLILYLFCAIFSSMGGYMPAISYLKILNMAFFVLGLYIVSDAIAKKTVSFQSVREFVFAFSIFIIVGSVLTLSRPHIAYYVSVSNVLNDFGVDAALTRLESLRQGEGLFCGMTNQSQALAPLLACLFGWVACDFILVEKAHGWLHLILLGITPVLMFMTRSRSALFSLGVGGALILFYLLPKIKLTGRVMRRIRTAIACGCIAMLVAGGYVEVRSKGISKWLRKTTDVETDNRGLGEALTSSRMGKIADAMNDFSKNPFLGMGFQVGSWTPYMYQIGKNSLFSAPVEKGFLPTMILGEGGVLGEMAFIIFLVSFYSGCKKRGYMACATLFTIELSTNFAEATIFSPGGGGACFWVISVLGGVAIDLSAKSCNYTGRLNGDIR